MFRTVAATALGAAVVGASGPNDGYEKAFKQFVNDFDKTYSNDVERMEKFENFKGTYDYITSENAKGNKYELGINEFSDMTPQEFAKTHFGYTRPEKPWGSLKKLSTHVYNGEPLADSVDWTTKGAVTPVKNQGQCGSCWSFSTTGSLEGALEIASGKLTSLSEEMLVDCSKQNHGCGGGSMDLAFEYVEKNGLCTEESYSYTSGGGKAGTCKASSCTKGLTAGQVTGFHDVTANSEKSLMSAVMLGPVSIAVEADKSVFQSYKSGVMTGMCGSQLDHGILVVGYGASGGTDYWKVKNSWGTVWGIQGYGNLERGKGSSGECGILAAATYPEVKKADEREEAFQKFEKDFQKNYSNDVDRMEKFQNFKNTFDYIKSENTKGNKYELGINEFSDMSPDEFAKTHFGYTKPEKPWGKLENLGTHVYNGEPLADSVDWTTKGAVTPVKNQGQCGSCWSFSTTGSLEGALEIKTGKLVSLSEEMLVDCSKQNHGCGGGSMDLAFQYVEKNGLCTEKSYSYTSGGGKAGTCKASSCTKGLTAGQVTGFHDVTANSEKALMSAVTLGPVSIAVEADKSVFQSYKSGVMTGMCGSQLDHGILVVGYGTSGGTAYWKVKNSWGTVWGIQGYGNLERGKGSSGECGILAAATYPVVSGSKEIVV